jgi:hypothetical protein
VAIWITNCDNEVQFASVTSASMAAAFEVVDGKLVVNDQPLCGRIESARRRALENPGVAVLIAGRAVIVSVTATVVADSFSSRVPVMAYELRGRPGRMSTRLRIAGLTRTEARVASAIAGGMTTATTRGNSG